MNKLRILNSKEIKKILAVLKDHFGADYSDLSKRYGFLINSKDRIFIVNKDFAKLDTQKVRINSVGIYLGEIYNEQIRCSIEGSQLLGSKAKQNVIEINDEQKYKWIRGNELEIEHKDTGFVIVKSGQDYIGTGRMKDNILLNFVNKNRQISSS
jgi:NOL1/NOP2/fmu family ribosome biogenesis protein